MCFIYPVVSYGCEAWVYKKQEENTLNTWWMKQLRKCYGCTKWDHVPNKTILNCFKTKQLTQLCKERRMGYAGHAYRYPKQERAGINFPERWVTQMWYCKLDGQQKTGRKTTWVKDVRNEMQHLRFNFSIADDKIAFRKKLKSAYVVV